MSGCSCYKDDAKKAREKIKELKNEYNNYSEVCDEIYAFISQIKKYKSFFTNLGTALETIIISRKTFDDGECFQAASNIEIIKGKLDDITKKIESAKDQINKEISRQYGFINNVYYCPSCKEKDAAAAVQ